MHPDEHDDHDDHDTIVTPTGSIKPHGKYMDSHVAKRYRMYAAKHDVRVLRKKVLTSYSADTYSGAIERDIDDNESFLGISLMERKSVRPAGRQCCTYIDEIT